MIKCPWFQISQYLGVGMFKNTVNVSASVRSEFIQLFLWNDSFVKKITVCVCVCVVRWAYTDTFFHVFFRAKKPVEQHARKSSLTMCPYKTKLSLFSDDKTPRPVMRDGMVRPFGPS